MKKIFLVIAVCLFSFFCYRVSLYLTDVMIPEKALEGWVSLVEETKEIKIPKVWGHVFNPGIVPYGDGYLLSFRAGSKNFKSWLKRHLKIEKKVFIAFVLLDKQFNPISEVSYCRHTSVLDSLGLNMGEDPRLIALEGKYYVIYNDLNFDEESDRVVKRVHIGEVVKRKNGFCIENIVALSFPDAAQYYEKSLVNRSLEKNWSPFVHENSLYLVYLLSPHVVIKPNLQTGLCKLVSENPEVALTSVGAPRGGTPALKLEDGYVAFFHTCLKGNHRFPKLHKSPHTKSSVYCFSAYLFEGTPPFKVKKRLEGFIGGKGLYEERRKMVYPSGYLVQGDNLYIVSGISDHRMALSKINKKRFLEAFSEVR